MTNVGSNALVAEDLLFDSDFDLLFLADAFLVGSGTKTLETVVLSGAGAIQAASDDRIGVRFSAEDEDEATGSSC